MEKTSIAKRKIANFEIHELIGSGGMANIYKGVQLSLARPVAIKLLHQHLTINKDFVVRFENEAKQAAQLAHPNIVAIIDFGHHEDEYFIAMEYIDGQNLKEIMTRVKRLPLEVALLTAREVANGLKYAHSSGLIHRDIKPANIMLSSDGRVVITDFGIAKTHNDLSITQTGQTIGSPAYMSPEQAAGRPIDNRCDIFSLGIVLYEIITGERPFKGDTYQEMVTSIISENPVPSSELRVDVNEEIEEIIHKAITKDIESRCQDANELVERISGQLETFIIPSQEKLISDYLKNPIRTTEKLRTDRISKHTESALYLLNLGHGRIEDAIKEFESVLRFDKNNKLAKEQLDKLKASQKDYKAAQPPKKRNLFLLLLAIISPIVLGAFLFRFVSGDSKSDKSEFYSGISETDSITAKIITPPVIEEFTVPVDDIATVPLPPTKKPPPTKGKTTVNKVKSKPKAKKKTTPKKTSAYNYPKQNIREYGFLKISSKPKAAFSVDNVKYGKTGGPKVKLPPGKHTIIIEAKGYKTTKKRIYTEKNESETISVKLKPDK
ncbi:MAG: serine/threonine protein kinase [candidate division Zixibacteria bacterium]|nr:serine/threonine protein kinase [candidate division Zixibacteria bacterium]